MSPSHDHVDFGPPFDDSDADIVLHSGFTSVVAPESTECRFVATDFLVHKLLLIKASSVFKSLLSPNSQSLDQQNDEALKHGIKCDTRGNLPVLCLSEDRDTIHRLLMAIYPIDIVYPQTFEATKSFAAARKYNMPSVLARFRTYFSRVAPVVTAEDAFRAYALASNEGLKEEALEAAQLTLSLLLTFETYGSSLCDASGPALLALWKHRGMVLEAIKLGVDQCLMEVGDLRDWKLNFPDNKECCIAVVPPQYLLQLFVQFAEKIPNFSKMNFFNFFEAMSKQRIFHCAICNCQLSLDNLCLYDCLERHVRGQIEQIHDELLSLLDGLGEPIDPRPSNCLPRNFGAPFDRGDSDVTIRSCDRVDFLVHKATLGIASPAFEDMFTAPGPLPHGQEHVKQVIELTESSKTLLHLLSVIYPMVPIVLDTLEDALSLLSACQKYQMDFIATRIRAMIRAGTPQLFTAENSFRAYGIAGHYQLGEEALYAAQLTLERTMSFNACGEDLRFISGADLFRLFAYRTQCTRDVKHYIHDTRPESPPQFSGQCPQVSRSGNKHTKSIVRPQWWPSHFVSRVEDQVSPKTVTDRQAFQSALASHRLFCASYLRPDETLINNAVCAALEAKMNKVIEQVRLDIPT